jgi:hypothetical protein
MDWTDQPPFAAGAAEARAAAGARATARPATAASLASQIPDLRIIVTLCLFAPGRAVARSAGIQATPVNRLGSCGTE